jgi:DNA polymerase-3 subunit delta
MKTPAFTFICGSDDFLVGRKAAKVWKSFQDEVGDPHSCELVDGQAANLDEVTRAVDNFAASVQTMSMFGEKKAVWLRGVTFMADNVTGRSEGAKLLVEKLQGILEGVDPDNVKVLITASPVDRRRKTFKWFQSHSDFTFLEESKDEGALVPVLVQEAKGLGCELTDAGARFLLAKIQGNTRLALEEVRKLSTYLAEAGGMIDEELVNELTPAFGEGDFFEAGEAFFSRNLAWTLDAIRRHFFAGYDARPLITSIQNRNRLLMQIKVLQDQGVLSTRINAASLDRARSEYGHHWKGLSDKSTFHLFTQNPFYLSRLADNAGKFTLKELIQNQVQCLEAFRALLQPPHDGEAAMRELAMRCLN